MKMNKNINNRIAFLEHELKINGGTGLIACVIILELKQLYKKTKGTKCLRH